MTLSVSHAQRPRIVNTTSDSPASRRLALALALALCAALAPARAHSQGAPADLVQTVERAALENPRVQAAWYGFESTRAERRVALSSYFPRLDVVADGARESSKTPVRERDRYRPDSGRFTLTQMLYDGFATRQEVSRLDHGMRARYHEFELAAEEMALEAVQVYSDVLRRQELVALAQDNHAQHRRIYGEIEQRVVAGVSRRVDLEQAEARLALAETNLLIESSNLHDVSVRFERVVGELPASGLARPELPVARIPEEPAAALVTAYRRHPRLKAARESLGAAHAERRSKNSPFLPRLDLRLSRQLDEDTDGIEGSFRKSRAELVFSYNVFSGGGDWAERKQFQSRAASALELQELACREVRQTLVIAHHDIGSLRAQLEYLNRNQLAIGKARLTYRQQFSIGQRTLLDLLDSENEYFEIRRRYVNAGFDLVIAQARVLAGMGTLLESLGIQTRPEDAGIDFATETAGSPCPEGAPLPARPRTLRGELAPTPLAPPPTHD
jgi:adhesin transport system outer membrane protein